MAKRTAKKAAARTSKQPKQLEKAAEAQSSGPCNVTAAPILPRLG